MADGGGLTFVDLAAHHARNAYLAHVIVMVQVADDRLQALVWLALGAGDIFEHRVQQWGHVLAGHGGVERRPALFGAGVNGGKIYLIVVRAQLYEQVYHLVYHALHVAAAVYLVDHHDGLFVQSQRLFQHVARLRHAPFHRVDEQKHAVHHGEDALHFAAEVRVSGRVDDVYLHAFIMQSRVFGEYGDAAFAFQIAAVHDALFHVLVFAEDLVLLQKLIHKRGLAVIDVRDDGNVSDIRSLHISSVPRGGRGGKFICDVS